MTPDALIARLTAAGLTDPDCLSVVRILAATEAAHVQQWSEIQRILTDAGIPMASVVQRVKVLAALARPDVGLPEGWTIDSDGEATNGLICVGPDGAKGIWIDGRWAPAEVVRAVLLRAAGVAS